MVADLDEIRPLFVAFVEALAQAERAPGLREQLAHHYDLSRRQVAAIARHALPCPDAGLVSIVTRPISQRSGVIALLASASRNQLARVEDSRRVERRLHRPQYLHAEIARLTRKLPPDGGAAPGNPAGQGATPPRTTATWPRNWPQTWPPAIPLIMGGGGTVLLLIGAALGGAAMSASSDVNAGTYFSPDANRRARALNGAAITFDVRGGLGIAAGGAWCGYWLYTERPWRGANHRTAVTLVPTGPGLAVIGRF